MAKFKDLTGQRFGKLIVIERAENGKHGVRFFCQCDCGNTKITEASTLTRGMCISCGCRKSLPQGEGAFRALYRYMEYNAYYRSIKWNIELEFFGVITKQSCHYCGAEPNQIYQPNRANGSYIYNGIDRVNNDIGYIRDNCVPCCGYCNWMKSAADVQDFKEWISKVYNHWASKS